MSPRLSEIDRLVARLLSTCGLAEPPFDARRIARELGIEVIFDQQRSGRARHKFIRGRSTIFVRPDERFERLQWSIAHELGEIYSTELLFQRCPDLTLFTTPDAESTYSQREQLASEIGTRLLLPEPQFSALADQHQASLTALKSIFSTASYELITRRLLTVSLPLVISHFDHGKLVRRTAPAGLIHARLSPTELACWRHVHTTGQEHQLRDDTLEIRGYPVHEPDWKREFLVTMPLERQF